MEQLYLTGLVGLEEILQNPDLNCFTTPCSWSRSGGQLLTFFQLSLAYKAAPFLDMANLAIWIHATVTLRLDYCDTVCIGLLSKSI